MEQKGQPPTPGEACGRRQHRVDHRGSEQGLDRFVAENDQGGHRSETGGQSLVAPCAADALDDVFAA
jgi:hypothetical protein